LLLLIIINIHCVFNKQYITQTNHKVSLLYLVLEEDYQQYSHPVPKIVTENSIKSPLHYIYQSIV
jgi:hypothetical protein